MTNENIIESILSLLAVDGTLNPKEVEFFKEMCKRLEVPKQTVNAVLEKARQGKGRVHLPEDEADKKRLLYFLVQAVVSDGYVAPEERKILDAVVAKMELDDVDLDDILESRIQDIREEARRTVYESSETRTIHCPKCGYEQTAAYKCKRCGIIFEKYKQVKGPSDEDKLRDILSSSNVIKEEEE